MKLFFFVTAFVVGFTTACSSPDFTVAEALDVDDGVDDTGTSALVDVHVNEALAETSQNDSFTVAETTVSFDTSTDSRTDVALDVAADSAMPPEVCEPLPTKGAPHCAEGDTCAIDDARRTYCRRANTGAGEVSCVFDTDCNVNFTCYAGKCALFCRSDADCCSGGPCGSSFNCKKSPILYTSPVTGATYGTCRT